MDPPDQAAEHWDGHTWSTTREHLACERPLQIQINEHPFTVTMRTPGQDEELVRGLLHSEGIATIVGTIGTITVDHDLAHVRVPDVYICKELLDRRTLAANSSCGFCGQRTFEDLTGAPLPALQPPLPVGQLPALMAALRSSQPQFSATGGLHAAGAIVQQELFAVAEDVGRHNAVDKVIGHSLTTGTQIGALAVSGRISYEIVVKAYRAGIPIIFAVSAPTSMAVATGERLGVSILGFCRDQRSTVYCGRRNLA